MFDIQVWKGNPIGYSYLTVVSELTGVVQHYHRTVKFAMAIRQLSQLS